MLGRATIWRRGDPIAHVESGGLVELLFLPEHEPIVGHDLSTLHQQEGEQESGDQDVSIPGGEVLLVCFSCDSADVPLFFLHDRLALLVLFLEVSRIRAFSFFSFFTSIPSLALSVSSSCCCFEPNSFTNLKETLWLAMSST